MATIQKRKRKDGTYSYRAIIRVHEGKAVVHTESATFAKQKDAKLWASKKETELLENGVPQTSTPDKSMTVAKLIEDYVREMESIKEYGRSKAFVLKKWTERDEGKALVSDVDSRWIIDFAKMRRIEENAGPSTVNHDIVHLRSVFAVAHDLLGVDVDTSAFDKARPTLTKLGLATKGGERDRRPEIEEITAIVEYAYNRTKSPHYRSEQVPLHKILVFQMFSSRRIAETCRIKWKNLDRDKQMVLVEDMKDPREKEGNDTWCFVPDEAWAIIESMEEGEPEERIFPYNPKSVGTAYRRYRDKLGLSFPDDDDSNLTIHDLRHECLSWLAEKNGLENEHWDIARLQLVSGHRGWSSLERYVNLLTKDPVDKWKDWEWKTKVLES